MDVEELLARAWGAVEKAGIPEPLQEFAFKEALARLSGQSPTQVPAAVSTNIAEPHEVIEGPQVVTPSTSSDPFERFAHESGVPAEDLERVFYFSEDGLPHINVPRSRLGRSATEQQKVVAVAITAAYDYVRGEGPISEDIARSEATRLRIDLANWARSMAGVQGVGWVGATRQKQLKVNNSTPDALKRIVAAVLGTPAE